MRYNQIGLAGQSEKAFSSKVLKVQEANAWMIKKL